MTRILPLITLIAAVSFCSSADAASYGETAGKRIQPPKTTQKNKRVGGRFITEFDTAKIPEGWKLIYSLNGNPPGPQENDPNENGPEWEKDWSTLGYCAPFHFVDALTAQACFLAEDGTTGPVKEIQGRSTNSKMAAINLAALTDSIEIIQWLEEARREGETYYPEIVSLLYKDTNDNPHRQIIFRAREMDGVAHTLGGGRVEVANNWIKTQPQDIGCMIHELVHVAQSYPRGNPGWLVESQADLVRWFHYEPKDKRPNPKKRHAEFKSTYQTGATFLFYIEEEYDDEINRKITEVMHKKEYNDALWEKWTGKTLEALWDEWRETLPEN